MISLSHRSGGTGQERGVTFAHLWGLTLPTGKCLERAHPVTIWGHLQPCILPSPPTTLPFSFGKLRLIERKLFFQNTEQDNFNWWASSTSPVLEVGGV